MAEVMTSRERMTCVYNHQEPDRVPMTDGPWAVTIRRWQKEGLPAGVGFAEFFGFEDLAGIGVDNSPRYPAKTVQETDEFRVTTTAWGATMRNWKNSASTPEFLDFTIKDRDSWAKAKARMSPTEDRVNWKHLQANYPKWVEKGAWISAGGWFGYDVFASWHVGTERMLVAMADDPEWCRDMFEHALTVDLRLLDMVWDRGYRFHCFSFPDDLGYRNGLFFSLKMYREVLKPVHRRAIEWAHARGVRVMMHSCGNIMELIPELVEIGLDGLNPIETKAGMDLVTIKKKFGARLTLQGGIDVRKMSQSEAIEEEIRTKVTAAKVGGGYIYHSDHSVPDSVSFADFCRVVELVKWYGRHGVSRCAGERVAEDVLPR